jgi:hypothetical protein
MLSKSLRFFLLTTLVFVVIYFVQQGLVKLFCIKNPDFVNRFYVYITGISLLMIINLLTVYIVKIKYVGYTFLAWSLLKLMLVMAYFVILIPKVSLSNNEIYEIVSLYLIYLIYEVFLGVLLLKTKIPAR